MGLVFRNLVKGAVASFWGFLTLFSEFYCKFGTTFGVKSWKPKKSLQLLKSFDAGTISLPSLMAEIQGAQDRSAESTWVHCAHDFSQTVQLFSDRFSPKERLLNCAQNEPLAFKSDKKNIFKTLAKLWLMLELLLKNVFLYRFKS